MRQLIKKWAVILLWDWARIMVIFGLVFIVVLAFVYALNLKAVIM
jgi:hypothetical protein